MSEAAGDQECGIFPLLRRLLSVAQMSKYYSLMTSSAGVSDQPSVNSLPARQSDPVPSGRGGGGKGVGKGKVKGDSGGTNKSECLWREDTVHEVREKSPHSYPFS